MLGIIVLAFFGLAVLSIMIPPLRAVFFLPFAMVQAWFHALMGDPYLPVVRQGPGPEKQQPLVEHAEHAEHEEHVEQDQDGVRRP